MITKAQEVTTNWLSNQKRTCPVCDEMFWTPKAYENHVETCEPLPEVFPTRRNFIKAAQTLAYAVHKYDTDKMGEPYKHHLKGVADGVRVLGGSDFAVAAAYLHDSIEDHPSRISGKYLYVIGFPIEVVRAVEAVTKKTNEEQGVYLQRVIDAGKDAMHVKLGDLLHNMRHDRHSALSEQTQDRLKKKYRPAIARLMLELELIADEDTQKKLATKPQGTAWTGGSYYGFSNVSSTVSGGAGSWFYHGSAIVVGDWIAGQPAPVAVKRGMVKGQSVIEYELANKAKFYAKSDKPYRLWTNTGWKDEMKARKAKGEDWSPHQEKQTEPPSKAKGDKK